MPSQHLLEAPLTRSIIGAFYEVYNHLGFGFLESIYVNAMERELRSRGHAVSREVLVQVRYKELEIGRHRLDMVVDNKMLNYLRATNLEVGLLRHFGPEPRFYRTVWENRARNPSDPPFPDYPIKAGAGGPRRSQMPAVPRPAAYYSDPRTRRR